MEGVDDYHEFIIGYRMRQLRFFLEYPVGGAKERAFISGLDHREVVIGVPCSENGEPDTLQSLDRFVLTIFLT